MRKNKLHAVNALLAFCLVMASCGTGTEVQPVCGTLEAPVPEDTLPDAVRQAFSDATIYHQYEIMSDTANSVSVWAIAEAGEQSTEGYGIVVMKNSTSTTFQHLRNTRQPHAAYNSRTGDLWLAVSSMEGSGVQVERLYQIRFTGDSAAITSTIDPYAVQQAFCQRLGYSAEDQQITLYIDGKPVTKVTNTITDMDGFDDHAVWVGEQICYDLSSGQPQVCITPGVKFITGPVLFYDDMPTFTAQLQTHADGVITLSDITPSF